MKIVFDRIFSIAKTTDADYGGVGRSMKLFFIAIENFWAWADKVDK